MSSKKHGMKKHGHYKGGGVPNKAKSTKDLTLKLVEGRVSF